MSLTINSEKIDWQEAAQSAGALGFTTLDIHVPKKITGYASSIEGKLHVSHTGLVYSHSSGSVLWIKFLGLASMLTISEVVFKCKSLAHRLFGSRLSVQEKNERKHISNLAAIARKAIVYWNGHPLIKRVEEFALAEINKNKGELHLMQELGRRRAERISHGYYARCMQPLFHVDQTLPKSAQTAERCNKYVKNAILSQNGCIAQTVKNATTETQNEIECCDVMCYKEQKICGIIYKIECCAISCFAVNFGCCLCVLWPVCRSVCVL